MGKGALSWSFSRAGSLEDCPRRHYYNYYFWDDDKPRALKTLNSLWMVAGQAVDITISQALEEVKPPTGEKPYDLASKGVELFNDLLNTSPPNVELVRKYRKPPQASRPLHDHFTRP